MITTFFQGAHSTEEVKKMYRNLVQIHHPDHGGDEETFKQLNAEYAFLMAHFIRSERPNQTEEFYSSMEEVNEVLRVIIEKLVKIPKIRIEVCGLWVWVDGDTKPVKEELKALKLHWAHKKEKWYFAGVPSSAHRPVSMDSIRSRYGSKFYQQEDINKNGGSIGN